MTSVFILMALTLPVGPFDHGRLAGVYMTEAACEKDKTTMEKIIIAGEVHRYRYFCSQWTVATGHEEEHGDHP